jgi:hypothetical protein
MISSKRIAGVVAGLLMLAVSASAFADGPGQYRRRHWQDWSRHHGWFQHHRRDAFYGQPPCPPSSAPMAWSDRPRPWNPALGNQSWQPNGASGWPWSNGRQAGWWNPGLSAHAPYNNQLLPGSSVTQQRAWLLERRAAAASEIEQLRARHDSRGAARLATVMQGLNQRLNNLGG